MTPPILRIQKFFKRRDPDDVRKEQIRELSRILCTLWSEQNRFPNINSECDLRLTLERNGDVLVQFIRWENSHQLFRGLVFRRKDIEGKYTLTNLLRQAATAPEVPHGWISEEECERRVKHALLVRSKMEEEK